MTALDRANLWLGLAVLLLGLVAWFEPGLEEQPSENISSLSKAQVSEITLYHNDNIKLSLLRDDAGWMMSHPQIARADSERVEKLLRISRQPSQRHFRVPPERLADFGLAQPDYRLQLNDTAILVGDRDPISNQRYLKVAELIHLVKDNFYQYLAAKPEQYLLQQADEATE